MVKPKFSAGPWVARDHEVCAGGMVLATTYPTGLGPVGERAQHANAQLMAAAPTILDALEWAMRQIGSYRQRTSSNGAYCDEHDKAMAAIALAKGMTK